MARKLIIIVAISLFLAACKKAPPSYDQRSPEATLKSFEQAVNAKRIPADLRRFTANPHEISTWKLRCKTAGGCVKASFQIVGPVVTTAERELLYVDYFVVGANGSTVIRGQRSPIYFEPAGSRWLIKQFGDQIVAKPKAPRHDAGPSASPDGSSP
jgi:hypothetical protein